MLASCPQITLDEIFFTHEINYYEISTTFFHSFKIFINLHNYAVSYVG